MSRLIIVSNRVDLPRSSQQPAAGGLAVVVSEALKHQQGALWFGWSGAITVAENTQVRVSSRGKIRYVIMDLPQADYDDYYNGYANRTLWPLFHYRLGLVVYDRQFQQGYFRVNRRFASALAPLIESDDLVWVHDYHLIACGEELRRLGVGNRIGFFLHIPFPTQQLLVTLPNHLALVRALFAYDLVGFQTESDLRALHEYIVQETDGKVEDDGRVSAFGRTLRAGVFPVGIDPEAFGALARTASAKHHFKRMTEALRGRGLIIGVDRLDYSKGLVQRLAAFERLLELYPDYRGKVSLMQIAPSSRQDVPEYNDIREQLEAASGRINGRFAEFDWVPIRYLNKALGRAALAGLFQVSRVGLVTPYRDGMNLIAKEYVAAQDPADPGCLVLSRFAGAAQQLKRGALIVNPYDTDDVAEGIRRGLAMPLEERQARWRSMVEVVRRYDAAWWCEQFVTALRPCAAAGPKA
ncbi:MAG: alpha,alpha-trehalose-phosphate synthase (UDP-forming) [Gammaproteobacteria bacterium]